MRRILGTIVCGLVLASPAFGADDDPEPKAVVRPTDPLPKNLWTRKKGSDWPCFLGPTHNSVSTEKGIVWPARGPRIVWHKTIGIGYSMPTVSRGRLFLFDRIRNRARLRCWKAETAESLWMFEYPMDYRDKYNYNGGPRCSPIVDGNRVYIYGPEGMLHCVRVTDGKLVWKVDTEKKFGVVGNFFGVGSSPVVEGNLLLVQVGGSPKTKKDVDFADLKSNGSALVAFDKFTGKVKYKVGDDLASYASPVVTSIGSRRWCFLFARGGLLGLNPATGKIGFHYPWRSRLYESVNASNPVVIGKRVFISECYEIGSALLDIKPSSAKAVWTDAKKGRKKSLLCHWMTPIHVGGYLYGSSGRYSAEAELRCIELATGKVMWRQKGLGRASLLLVDKHFVCLGEEGDLRLLKVNPKKYDEVSSVVLREPKANGKPDPGGKALLKEPCWAAPILAHGLLYVRGEGRLVCLELIPRKKK